MGVATKSTIVSDEHRLLLRAALIEGAQGVESWERWRKTVDFEAMDEASMRLMPLVSWNQSRIGYRHELTDRLRGLRRYWWIRNQVLMRGLAGVLDKFAAESIDVMALKGVPLAHDYYEDPGLRPMSDFDLLVPTDRADRGVELLLESGEWRINEPVPLFGPDGRVDTGARPGVGFASNVRDDECDLHWHMLHDCCYDGAEDSLWSRAVSMTVHERKVLAPDPTDLFMHVCVHGAAFNPMPPIRWIADAATIVRTAGDSMDWNRLAADADERLLSLVMREAVRLLRVVGDVEVPDFAVALLDRARVSAMERHEYGQRIIDQNYLRTISGRWCQLHRQYRHVNPVARIAKIPSFMQKIWSIPSKRALPGIVAFRVIPAYVRNIRSRYAGLDADDTGAGNP
jgi:hypothetical protein